MLFRPTLLRRWQRFKSTSASEAHEALVQRFQAEGISEPESSASWLVSAVLGSNNRVTNLAQHELNAEQQKQLQVWAQCRLARMPVQYILKEWDFGQLTLKMRPPVFIPRPETEELVKLALPMVKDGFRGLEVGCGSGAITLSLLQAKSDVAMVAVDKSQEACVLTLENAVNLGLDKHHLTVKHAALAQDGELFVAELATLILFNCFYSGSLDIGEPLGSFDFIISNPPYVLRKDLMTVAPEIKLYEDLRALDGGAEGLDVIKSIMTLSSSVLKAGGYLFLEFDPCHALILPQEVSNYGLSFKSVHKDFAGKDRYAIIYKPE